jgi:glutamate-1-semialdehyde 2,1-aminomutase
VVYCNSGSEATSYALRLARAVTGRRKILKFQGCSHGFHDAVCLNVISPADRLDTLDPLSQGSVPEVLANTIVCEFNNLDDESAAIARNSEGIAAIILEPVSHNIGCVMPRPGFLEGLRELTRDRGIRCCLWARIQLGSQKKASIRTSRPM